MKSRLGGDKKRRVLPFLLVVFMFIILSLLFVVFLRDVIREFVISPLLYLVFQVQLIWRSLPSDLIWGFFVLFASLLAALVFPAVQNQLETAFSRRHDSNGKDAVGQSPVQDRSQLNSNYMQDNRDDEVNREVNLIFWYEEVNQMYSHQYLPRYAVVELKKLVMDEIAFRERMHTRQQAEYWLNENPEKVPPEIWSLFNPDSKSPLSAPDNRKSWLTRLLQSWGLLLPDISPVAVDRSIDAILAFLESNTHAESRMGLNRQEDSRKEEARG